MSINKRLDTSSFSEKHVETLARLLYEKAKQEKRDKVYPAAKTVLSLLGIGITIAAAFAVPKTASALIDTF